MVNPENIPIIEKFVNSPEAVEVVAEHWDWEGLMKLLSPQLASPLTEEEETTLARDLRDWWKNGNFRHWEEGEVGLFGLMQWEFGDLAFWGYTANG